MLGAKGSEGFHVALQHALLLQPAVEHGDVYRDEVRTLPRHRHEVNDWLLNLPMEPGYVDPVAH